MCAGDGLGQCIVLMIVDGFQTLYVARFYTYAYLYSSQVKRKTSQPKQKKRAVFHYNIHPILI